MSQTIWHVDITMNKRSDGIFAEARLSDGSHSIRGVGHISKAMQLDDLDHEYTLAAARSLDALSGVLGYRVEMSNLGAADQA